MKARIRRNESYVLKSMAGIHYLLPYGQMIADFRKGISLNETGKWLYESLEKPLTRTAVIKKAVEYYEAPPEQEAQIASDINTFIDRLVKAGILIEDAGIPRDVEGGDTYYGVIGGLNVRFSCPGRLFPTEFQKFLRPTLKGIHINIAITEAEPPGDTAGQLLIRYEELMVVKSKGKYILFFPRALGVREAHLSEKGASCVFYVTGKATPTALHDLFRSIRVPLLYKAGLGSKIALHSSSILYEGRAWLFSAPSGVGKSHHSFMWNRLYGTPLINGDTNIIGLNKLDCSPELYGSPWCGTSHVCDDLTHKVGGIILLRQSDRDYVEELSPAEKRLLVLQRLISPSWEERSILANLDMVETIIPHIMVCRLNCTMDRKAVDIIKERIDSYTGY